LSNILQLTENYLDIVLSDPFLLESPKIPFSKCPFSVA